MSRAPKEAVCAGVTDSMNSKPSSDHHPGGALPSVPSRLINTMNNGEPDDDLAAGAWRYIPPNLALDEYPRGTKFWGALMVGANFVSAIGDVLGDRIARLLNADAATTGATTARAPTSPISPPAVDAVAAPMTPSAGAVVAWRIPQALGGYLYSTTNVGHRQHWEPLYASPQAAPDSAAPQADVLREAREWLRSAAPGFVQESQRHIDALLAATTPSAGAASAGDEQRHARALLSAINNSDFDVPAYDEATCWLESLAAAHPTPQNPKDNASSVRGTLPEVAPVVGEES